MEYALIIALVAVVAISVLMATGRSVSSTFGTVNAQLATAQNGGVGGATPGQRGGG